MGNREKLCLLTTLPVLMHRKWYLWMFSHVTEEMTGCVYESIELDGLAHDESLNKPQKVILHVFQLTVFYQLSTFLG